MSHGLVLEFPQRKKSFRGYLANRPGKPGAANKDSRPSSARSVAASLDTL